MIDYIVAGSSDCQETAELENYCNVVSSTFQNIRAKMIIKHPKDWPGYLTEICRIHGFKEKLNPICFTPEGILIGDAKQFKDSLEKKYGLSELKNHNSKQISKDCNVELVNEDYEYRHRDKGLKELVNDTFQSQLLKGSFTFNKEPFKKIAQDANYNFVKFTNFATPSINVKTEKKVDTSYLDRHDPEWDISTAVFLDKHPDEPEVEDPKKDAKKDKAKDKAQDLLKPSESLEKINEAPGETIAEIEATEKKYDFNF